MMMEFVQQNRNFLRIYGRLASFFGRVFLGFGLIWAILFTPPLVSRLGNWNAFQDQFEQMPRGIFLFIACGLLALGISQFIRYLTEEGYQPGRILRHGDKLLYAYAVYIIVDIAWALRYYHFALTYQVFIDLLLAFLIMAGKIFILVGLAQLLKRILPMIEESKTLV
jgi:hypothetical protein